MCICITAMCPILSCLLRNGAQLQGDTKDTKCATMQWYWKMSQAAQQACFCFIFGAKFRLPKDIILTICRDNVWASRRDCDVWCLPSFQQKIHDNEAQDYP